MGTVIKMFGDITGGAQDAAAQIDIPMPGHLVGVYWSTQSEVAGADSDFAAQLSFRSASAFVTNDDRGIISEVRQSFDLTTSGGNTFGVNVYHPLPDVPVMGGERLFLHLLTTAAAAGDVICLLSFDFDLDKISMRRR